jgi:hypothetical protein
LYSSFRITLKNWYAKLKTGVKECYDIGQGLEGQLHRSAPPPIFVP